MERTYTKKDDTTAILTYTPIVPVKTEEVTLDSLQARRDALVKSIDVIVASRNAQIAEIDNAIIQLKNLGIVSATIATPVDITPPITI